MLPDLKVKNKALIYKDKYRFVEDNMYGCLRANLDHLEENYHLPKWNENALVKKEP